MSILKSLEKQQQMLQTKENPEPTASSCKSQLSGKICWGKFTGIFTPLVETFYVAPLKNYPNITISSENSIIIIILRLSWKFYFRRIAAGNNSRHSKSIWTRDGRLSCCN